MKGKGKTKQMKKQMMINLTYLQKKQEKVDTTINVHEYPAWVNSENIYSTQLRSPKSRKQ